MQHLFISGMFRSGTTFLARALNAHPNVAVASDAFMELFKEARNKYYLAHGVNLDPSAPLGDGFLEDPVFLRSFHEAFLDIEFHSEELPMLVQKIQKKATEFSALLMPLLDTLQAGTVRSLILQIMESIPQAYPTDDLRITGVKHVWTDEFTRMLVNDKDLNARCIHLIRDPRAVLASKNCSSIGRYPIMFIARHWRKSIAYSFLHENQPNVLQVFYENLVREPECTMKEICNFLEIPFDPAMLDANNYRGGDGSRWQQNTSYEPKEGIRTDSIEKWRQILSDDEVRLVEWLCGPEMDAMGYERTQTTVPYDLFDHFEEDVSLIAKWIAEKDFSFNEKRKEQELLRHSLLTYPHIPLPQEHRDAVFITEPARKRLTHSL